jgi:uncharacterized protein YydD (DUF2326 family)
MLRRLSANRDSFRPISFNEGFNLVLADRSPEATDKHSRNARGKTTMLHMINYCLGGSLPSALRPLIELEWAFTLQLDLFGGLVSATRSLKGGNRLSLEYDSNAAGVLDTYVGDRGRIKLEDWKFLLGLGLFGLDSRMRKRSSSCQPGRCCRTSSG